MWDWDWRRRCSFDIYSESLSIFLVFLYVDQPHYIPRHQTRMGCYSIDLYAMQAAVITVIAVPNDMFKTADITYTCKMFAGYV